MVFCSRSGSVPTRSRRKRVRQSSGKHGPRAEHNSSRVALSLSRLPEQRNNMMIS